jgi:hypothetical protein
MDLQVPDDFQPEEQEAMEYLSSLRLDVKPVPRGPSRTAEFLVDGDGRGYAVEVKAREDSEEWNAAMNAGVVASQSRSMGSGTWAKDVVRKKALKQLSAVDPEHRRWWLVWLAVQVRAARHSMEREVFGTLFGVRQVVFWKKGEGPATRDCLFAEPGVFERNPEIVAAMVQPAPGKFALALNDFAPDLVDFKSSVVYRDMLVKGAVSDADSLCTQPAFVRVTDFQIDRRSEGAVIAHLTDAYGPGPYKVVDMQEHTAAIRVPVRPQLRHVSEN